LELQNTNKFNPLKLSEMNTEVKLIKTKLGCSICLSN